MILEGIILKIIIKNTDCSFFIFIIIYLWIIINIISHFFFYLSCSLFNSYLNRVLLTVERVGVGAP